MKNAHLPLSQVAAGREQQLILQVDKCFISLVAFLYEQGGTLSVKYLHHLWKAWFGRMVNLNLAGSSVLPFH